MTTAQSTQPDVTVSSVEQLVDAVHVSSTKRIIVAGHLCEVPSIRLAPGLTLAGADDAAHLTFASGSDGLQLTCDNMVHSLSLHSAPERRALFNDTEAESLGRIELRGVTTTGRVQILARNRVRGGHLEVNGLALLAADARAEHERPHGYGVSVVQGAFTLWNMQPDESVVVSASLCGLSIGCAGTPVRGSGVFVSGAGDSGGRLVVDRLETDAVYSEGGIAPGTPDQITGGVFVVAGAYVNGVRNLGPVVTYGTNDMALDNWGTVDRWLAEAPITTYGPSAIGVVNFGRLNELRTAAPVETFGQGARGFNVYDGTVVHAEFDRVVTHADGAVGIQISRPVGRLLVHRGIETFGGTGQSLVKGVLTMLPAIGLSVKPGGSAQHVDISGGLRTHGAGVLPLEVQGTIETLRIRGGCGAAAPDEPEGAGMTT